MRTRLTTLKNQSPKKPSPKEDAIDRVAAALVMATGDEVEAQRKCGVTPSLGDQIYEAAAALFRQRLERMPPDAKSPIGALFERDMDTYTLTPLQANSIMALSLSMMYPGIVKKILREPGRVVELARLFPEGDAVQQALDIRRLNPPPATNTEGRRPTSDQRRTRKDLAMIDCDGARNEVRRKLIAAEDAETPDAAAVERLGSELRKAESDYDAAAVERLGSELRKAESDYDAAAVEYRAAVAAEPETGAPVVDDAETREQIELRGESDDRRISPGPNAGADAGRRAG